MSVLTPAEYLVLERRSETRNAYVARRMVSMPRSNRDHALITGNVSAEINRQLRTTRSEVYAVAMRVKIAASGIYTYPDIVAVSDEPQCEDAEADTLLNPTVIVEVFSPATEAYDRGEKFAHYRRLESLREYVLVAQNAIRIEHYRRNGDQWIRSDVGDTLDLPSIGCSVSVAAIYEKVVFF